MESEQREGNALPLDSGASDSNVLEVVGPAAEDQKQLAEAGLAKAGEPEEDEGKAHEDEHSGTVVAKVTSLSDGSWSQALIDLKARKEAQKQELEETKTQHWDATKDLEVRQEALLKCRRILEKEKALLKRAQKELEFRTTNDNYTEEECEELRPQIKEKTEAVAAVKAQVKAEKAVVREMQENLPKWAKRIENLTRAIAVGKKFEVLSSARALKYKTLAGTKNAIERTSLILAAEAAEVINDKVLMKAIPAPKLPPIEEWIDWSDDEKSNEMIAYEKKWRAKKKAAADYLKMLRRDFRQSAIEGNLSIFQPLLVKMLSKGQDINNQADETAQNQNTALIEAAQRGNHMVCKVLIRNKAMLELRNDEKETAMVCAAKNGYHKVVRLLLKGKAKHNVESTFGCTPLILASEYDHHECVDILIRAKSNINARTEDERQTPLMLCAECDCFKSAHLLIEARADIELIDAEGNAAIDIGTNKFHEEVVSLLVKERWRILRNKELAANMKVVEKKGYNYTTLPISSGRDGGTDVDRWVRCLPNPSIRQKDGISKVRIIMGEKPYARPKARAGKMLDVDPCFLCN